MELDRVREKIRKNYPAKPFELKWRKVPDNRNKIVSECGQFWIIKVGEEFQVWGRWPNRDVHLHDHVLSSQEAKLLASSHAASREMEEKRAVNPYPLKQSAHARLAEGPK